MERVPNPFTLQPQALFAFQQSARVATLASVGGLLPRSVANVCGGAGRAVVGAVARVEAGFAHMRLGMLRFAPVRLGMLRSKEGSGGREEGRKE